MFTILEIQYHEHNIGIQHNIDDIFIHLKLAIIHHSGFDFSTAENFHINHRSNFQNQVNILQLKVEFYCVQTTKVSSV